MKTTVMCLFAGSVLLVCATSTFAQAPTTPRDTRLLVTVVDTTGGILQGATVKVTGQDEATKATVTGSAMATEKGLATISSLKPASSKSMPKWKGSSPA